MLRQTPYVHYVGSRARARIARAIIGLSGAITRFMDHKCYYYIAKIAGGLAEEGTKVTITLTADSRFCFYLRDPYWSRLLSRHYVYEPEIEFILTVIKNLKYVFVDLGANYGYWSIMASSYKFGCHAALAVEPLEANYSILTQNCLLNDKRFSVVRAAVSKSGMGNVAMRLDPQSISNAGASGADAHNLPRDYNVEYCPAITIDALMAVNVPDEMPLVVKLDVEGMEVEALEGATLSLRQDCLLIYEDHGMDSECKVSQYIMKKGMTVYWFDGKGLSRINDINEIRSIKTKSSKGYNFFAVPDKSIFKPLIAN